MPGSKPTANNKLSFPSRRSSLGALGMRHTSHINMPPICVYNSWFKSARELLSLCLSTMLPLNFCAPAFEELAVPDCFSTPHTFYCRRWRSRSGWWEIAVVDSRMRAACLKHGLTSFHICCRRLESVSHNEGLILLSFNYFLPWFISYSY
jgi:hypothetical protein